ncbi:DUF4231 domain-containing protein [Micromonospora sp. CPCC 205561]|uniref:DUF4231 domain-containing protein n=1 Tax=Micromonospora sp. CPCC 205561 TaxID=3122407 RepID=UPI002FF2CE6E
MANFDIPAAVATVWQRQASWSWASGGAKRTITGARLTIAALTVGAAVCGTLANQLGQAQPAAGRALAIVAATALLLVPLAARWASREAVHAWTRLRSVSEALKADTYRYLAGVAPFGGADRDAVLLGRFDALMDDAGDLVGRTLDAPPAARPLPAVSDVPSYVAERLQRQVDGYYLPAARRMARAARRVRYAATGLTVAAALVSATVGVLGDNLGLTAWIGVAAAVTTALAGYGSAQQYEHHQIEYARTADQLTRLRTTREAGRGWTDDDAFVAEAERIISLSNEGWMARMIEQDGAAQQ